MRTFVIKTVVAACVSAVTLIGVLWWYEWILPHRHLFQTPTGAITVVDIDSDGVRSMSASVLGAEQQQAFAPWTPQPPPTEWKQHSLRTAYAIRQPVPER